MEKAVVAQLVEQNSDRVSYRKNDNAKADVWDFFKMIIVDGNLLYSQYYVHL